MRSRKFMHQLLLLSRQRKIWGNNTFQSKHVYAPEWSEFPLSPLWECRPQRCIRASWRWTERCSHSGTQKNKEMRKVSDGFETDHKLQRSEWNFKYLCVSLICVYWQRWVRWAMLRDVAAGWWCVCVPAAPPDGAACNRSAGEAKTREKVWVTQTKQKKNHSCTLISAAPWDRFWTVTLVLALTFAWFFSRKLTIFTLP